LTVEGERVKQRHRVRVALAASAALAVGAGVAFAAVPTAPPAGQQSTQNPVSATYPTTSAELATLQAELNGSAQDTALLRSLIARLQHQVDAAQARLERLGRQPGTPTGVVPTPAQPINTPAPTTAHRSPSPRTSRPELPTTSPRPSPSDDDGSGGD
jgi:hypothetical protein